MLIMTGMFYMTYFRHLELQVSNHVSALRHCDGHVGVLSPVYVPSLCCIDLLAISSYHRSWADFLQWSLRHLYWQHTLLWTGQQKFDRLVWNLHRSRRGPRYVVYVWSSSIRLANIKDTLIKDGRPSLAMMYLWCYYTCFTMRHVWHHWSTMMSLFSPISQWWRIH